jgi:hypothetical protein
VKLIIDEGVGEKINERGVNLAMLEGCTEIIELHISRGMKDKIGEEAVNLAMENGHSEIMDY